MKRRSVVGGLFVLGTGVLGWAYGTVDRVQASEGVSEDPEPIDPGTTVDGTVAVGEEAWYAIELSAEETLSVVFDSEFGDWAEQRAVISVSDSDGTVLDSVEMSTDEPIRTAIGTTVAEPGTYAVRIASLDGEIPYSVTIDVADEDPNEPNGDRQSAADIAVGESSDGVVIGGEEDWFAFDAVAGEGIELELTARDLALNRDIAMALFDPNGTEIGALPTDNPYRGAYRTDYQLLAAVGSVPPSRDSSVVGADVAEETGRYYVRVSEVGPDTVHGEVRGFTAYTLTVETTELDEFDPNERRETATRLESDETIDAVIAGYDQDWYAFDVEEDDEITVVYEIVQEMDLFDPTLVLHTPGGEPISLDRSADGVTVVATTTGTWYLLVTPDDDTTARDFVARETYRLTIVVGDEDRTDQASVTITDQTSDGTWLIVDDVTVPEGGFVAIHDETLLTANDPFGSIRGVSSYLEVGSHERVAVTLDEPIEETQRLWVMAHDDTNEIREFDFETTGGEEDGPYTFDDRPVMADACITIV